MGHEFLLDNRIDNKYDDLLTDRRRDEEYRGKMKNMGKETLHTEINSMVKQI